MIVFIKRKYLCCSELGDINYSLGLKDIHGKRFHLKQYLLRVHEFSYVMMMRAVCVLEIYINVVSSGSNNNNNNNNNNEVTEVHLHNHGHRKRWTVNSLLL